MFYPYSLDGSTIELCAVCLGAECGIRQLATDAI
jgi:hypothetical protein